MAQETQPCGVACQVCATATAVTVRYRLKTTVEPQTRHKIGLKPTSANTATALRWFLRGCIRTMAQRNVKGAIDLTDLPGETHFSEIGDENVVAGSNGEEAGEMQTDGWPEALPEEKFNGAREDVVKLLSVNDDTEQVAEALDVSTSTVAITRQLAAVFAEPSEVPFSIPPHPTHESSEELHNALEHPEARDVEIESIAGKSTSTETTAKNTKKVFDEETVKEMLGRYYVLKQSAKQIADDMGLESDRKVTGALRAKSRFDRDEWIVPGEESEIEGREEETVSEHSDTTSEPDSTFPADATAEEVEITACECRVPSFAVDAQSLGPYQMQLLYCSDCEFEFTLIRTEME